MERNFLRYSTLYHPEKVDKLNFFRYLHVSYLARECNSFREYIYSSSKTIDMNIKLCRYYVYFCLWKKDFWQWEETLHLTCIPNKIIYVYLSTPNYEWILLWMCIPTPCTFMYFFAPIIAFGQKILAKQIAKWDLLAMQTTF